MVTQAVVVMVVPLVVMEVPLVDLSHPVVAQDSEVDSVVAQELEVCLIVKNTKKLKEKVQFIKSAFIVDYQNGLPNGLKVIFSDLKKRKKY